MCIQNVEIASLLPYESAGVFHRVLSFYNSIAQGTESNIPPIHIFEFGGRTVVREGANRVIAFRLHRRTHIPARQVEPPAKRDLVQFTVELREQEQMQGFAHLPIDQTDEDRERRTNEEFQLFLNH